MFLVRATVGALALRITLSVTMSVCQFVSVFTRRRARLYDVPTSLLLLPLDCWQNSTPFFGMYALWAEQCQTQIF